MNGSAAAAKRIATGAEASRWHEGSRKTIYFAADGRRLAPGGRSFTGNGDADWKPSVFAFAVEYPFCPSVLSCADMVIEHDSTGKPVTYDEERWEGDERVDQQAGPSITDHWVMLDLMRQVAA